MYKNMSQYNKWNLSHEIYLFAFRVHKLTKFARIGRMSVVVAELLVTSVSIAIINVSRRFMAHGGMLLNTSNCSPMNADNPDFCEKKYFSSIRLSASLCTNYSLLLRWYWFIFLIYLKITYLPSLEGTSLQEIIF